uniref:BESS domain-containing protein n=1 Tax=Sinocyclocheilus rhinocerous TaxID=307959 RepID=A0A673HWA8_9TELE
ENGGEDCFKCDDFPELYDPSKISYRDIKKKSRAWEPRVGLPVEEVRKKLKNLRDKYIKERRAMKEKKSGSEADSQKVWKYFNIMSFLEPHVRERPTSSNMMVNEEEQEVILTLEPVTVQIEQEVSDISTTGEDSLAENENENSSQKVDEISKQLKDCGDEDELFLMSLVPAFKRLSEIQKSTARIEIMRVLHDIQFKEK